MLRAVVNSAFRCTSAFTANAAIHRIGTNFAQRAHFSVLNYNKIAYLPEVASIKPKINILQNNLSTPLTTTHTRTVTKFSLIKGKRKSVKAVLKRFKRLDWGIWIRTHSGRHKKLYKKSAALKRRLRQHVFTNATQSWLLDKMVTSFWRRPKNYVDDPYEPYHRRDEFFATTRKTFKV